MIDTGVPRIPGCGGSPHRRIVSELTPIRCSHRPEHVPIPTSRVENRGNCLAGVLPCTIHESRVPRANDVSEHLRRMSHYVLMMFTPSKIPMRKAAKMSAAMIIVESYHGRARFTPLAQLKPRGEVHHHDYVSSRCARTTPEAVDQAEGSAHPGHSICTRRHDLLMRDRDLLARRSSLLLCGSTICTRERQDETRSACRSTMIYGRSAHAMLCDTD